MHRRRHSVSVLTFILRPYKQRRSSVDEDTKEKLCEFASRLRALPHNFVFEACFEGDMACATFAVMVFCHSEFSSTQCPGEGN